MISCEEFTDRVTAYLEGRVPMGEKMGMWMHSVLCKHCRRYLQQMKLVVDLSGEVSNIEAAEGPDEATKNELLEQFRQRTSPCDGSSAPPADTPDDEPPS